MLSRKEKLEILAGLSVELNLINDLDLMLERVLTRARQCANADAGSIYIRDGDHLHFTYTQNDTLQERLAPGDKLIYSTFTIPVDKKSIAGFVAATGESLHLEDVRAIGAGAPYGFDASFDEAADYRTQSMFTLPLMNGKRQVLGVLQVINARDETGRPSAFSADDRSILESFASIAAVALEKAQMTRAILLRMIGMAELHDPKETGAHVNRVGTIAVELYERWAQRRNIDQAEIDKTKDVLRMAAMLHDVGKVGISDLILKKPGKLEPEEFDTMKTHTLLGARLFAEKTSDFDEAAAQVALNHHEWWDGSPRGYPGHVDVATGRPLPGHTLADGRPAPKKGEEIPIFGRIVALVDVYDALSSPRCYKEPWPDEKITAIIEEEGGSHFDPELVEIFLNNYKVIKALRQRYGDAC